MWKILLVCALSLVAQPAYSELPAFAKLPEAVQEKLGALIKGNMHAAFQYLIMSTFQSRVDVNHHGYEMMFNAANHEKLKLAVKMMTYMTNRGGEIHFEDIPVTENEKFGDAHEVVLMAQKTERELAKQLTELIKAAPEHGDPHTAFFLESHVTKVQIETVINLTRLLTILKNGGKLAIPLSDKGLELIYGNKTLC